MTWKSHRVLTGFAVLLYSHNPFYAMAAAFGSTFPDMVEMTLPGPAKWYHRKLSHWFVPYLAALLVLTQVAPWLGSSHRTFSLIVWFLVGCLAHIAEDAVCGKVPVLDPNKPVYVCPRLFYAGSPKEYVFVAMVLAVVTLATRLIN